MPALTQANFNSPQETSNFVPPESGHVNLVVDGTVGLGTFNPGWQWSKNVKPLAGTELCEAAHACYFISGRMMVEAKDGSRIEYGPGDVATMDPGHDAWVVGGEPCVVIDWAGFTDYAKPK
jgi:hypothetical protein